MESGKATIQYKYLYGYRRGTDDKPEIIPEEAEAVRWIYERYLAGASTRMLRDELHEQGVIYAEKSPQWTLPHIKSILRNEKYCGDVLMQKTFQQDVINRKVIKNTGQLPMPTQAIQDYSHAINLQPDLLEAYHYRGIVRYGMKDLDGEIGRAHV